jgi:hypothetical protein
LFWDPVVYGHAFTGNIELGPDTTLVEEEEVAKHVGFEDRNCESKVDFDYVFRRSCHENPICTRAFRNTVVLLYHGGVLCELEGAIAELPEIVTYY